MESLDERLGKASSAEGEGIGPLLRDPSPAVIFALLSNPNTTNEHLTVIARRRDVQPDILSAIAARKLTLDGERVKVALVNNPKTPRRTALSLLRSMQLRDMAFVTRNKALPTELRQVAEGILKEKLPTVPLGVRVTLARQVSEEVIKALLLDETKQLIKACFENPVMRESVVLWAVNHEKTPAGVVEFIAESPRWSACYHVRYALMRNSKTPVERALGLVRGLKSPDQRQLYNDPTVPAAVKVQIEIELEKKLEPLHPPRDGGRIIGIPEEEP